MSVFSVSFLSQLKDNKAFLCLFPILLFFTAISCNEKTSKKSSASNIAQADTAKVLAPEPSSSFFNSLKLLRADYNTLRRIRYNKNNKLVFQFYYPQTYTGGSPQLVGYAMKSKNDSISTVFKILTPVGSSGEPLYGREQILGDQQIRFGVINSLLEKVLGKGDPEYDYLFLHQSTIQRTNILFTQ
jgi:hypothetical protein